MWVVWSPFANKPIYPTIQRSGWHWHVPIIPRDPSPLTVRVCPMGDAWQWAVDDVAVGTGWPSASEALRAACAWIQSATGTPIACADSASD